MIFWGERKVDRISLLLAAGSFLFFSLCGWYLLDIQFKKLLLSHKGQFCCGHGGYATMKYINEIKLTLCVNLCSFDSNN